MYPLNDLPEKSHAKISVEVSIFECLIASRTVNGNEQTIYDDACSRQRFTFESIAIWQKLIKNNDLLYSRNVYCKLSKKVRRFLFCYVKKSKGQLRSQWLFLQKRTIVNRFCCEPSKFEICNVCCLYLIQFRNLQFVLFIQH